MSKSKSRRQTGPQKKEEDANTVLEKLNMVEREVRTEEGQVYLMRTSPYRSEEDRINGVVITFIDSTERKKAEQHIRESEARFRLFVMASTDTIYRMSADWSQMLLLNGEDFLEDADKPNARWLDQYIPEAEQVRVNAAIEEAIRSKGIFELEHRVKREDGSIGWTFSRAIPVLNNKNEIVEWFGAASDITAQKEAEGALHEHVDELTRFNRAMVSRESRMIELKKEVNDLRQKLGEPQAYPLEFEVDGGTSSAGAEQDCTEKEVNELRRRQGEPKTYPLDFEKEGQANEQELNK
jgi:two-component system CheB/CheR fusion protein